MSHTTVFTSIVVQCVYTLLLDDAFKLATPLTNGVISETLRQFVPLSDVSQGSVATH